VEGSAGHRAPTPYARQELTAEAMAAEGGGQQQVFALQATTKGNQHNQWTAEKDRRAPKGLAHAPSR
jgi:hypothetical protein